MLFIKPSGFFSCPSPSFNEFTNPLVSLENLSLKESYGDPEVFYFIIELLSNLAPNFSIYSNNLSLSDWNTLSDFFIF